MTTPISPEVEQTIRAGLSKIRTPTARDKVYKEECVYSYDNPVKFYDLDESTK